MTFEEKAKELQWTCERRGYTSNYKSVHNTLCAAHDGWQSALLYTRKSGDPTRLRGKDVPS